MRCFFPQAICFLLLATGALTAQQFPAAELRTDIAFLASDELKGRGTGSPEEMKAAAYISTRFRAAGLKPIKGMFLKSFSFKKNPNPHDTSTAGVKVRKGQNVVGYLDNGAPFTVVIGGHYDHLGLGHDHNSLEANPEGKIHNGADDNASGTAGVIALAKHFAGNGAKEPFNLLFICFSGEELGLIGSKKWCEHPDVDLRTISYMINLDMVGRLNDSTRKLVVYGVGTSPVFVPILDSLKSEFVILKDSSGVGPSDQTSFYLKDIPVLHFFTGQHSDYHKPSDDADKVNYEGESKVLSYIVRVIESTYPHGKLSFQKTKNRDGGKASFKVTLGVMPDYTFEGPGMRIDGVTDGRPAANAGMQRGDVIVRMGEMDVQDIHAYMKALSTYKKGDSAEVTVKRGQELKKMQVTF
jgi:hypothetical protein